MASGRFREFELECIHSSRFEDSFKGDCCNDLPQHDVPGQCRRQPSQFSRQSCNLVGTYSFDEPPIEGNSDR